MFLKQSLFSKSVKKTVVEITKRCETVGKDPVFCYELKKAFDGGGQQWLFRMLQTDDRNCL